MESRIDDFKKELHNLLVKYRAEIEADENLDGCYSGFTISLGNWSVGENLPYPYEYFGVDDRRIDHETFK